MSGPRSGYSVGVHSWKLTALMLYLSQSFRSLSIPTVAPKIPREMSVGLAGAPVLVLSLTSVNKRGSIGHPDTYQPLTASISMPYEHKARFGILRELAVDGLRYPATVLQKTRELKGLFI